MVTEGDDVQDQEILERMQRRVAERRAREVAENAPSATGIRDVLERAKSKFRIYDPEELPQDESELPTGTHKARRAWEKVVGYKALIRERLAQDGPLWLPAYSIISSGSDAVALQYFLRQFNLPDLRVVMDEARAKEDVLNRLEQLGALVFPVDLEERELTRVDAIFKQLRRSGMHRRSPRASLPPRCETIGFRALFP